MVAVTSLYAALCALLVLVLAARVALYRRSSRIGIGDGGDRVLARAVRAHANAIEYLPLALILLLLAELGGAHAWLLHGCGIALVAARILHAFGLSRSAGYSPGRLIGTVATWLVVIVLAATLLV